MDTKLKSQLYDIISLAENRNSDELVEIGNVKIRKEDVEKYREVQRKLNVINSENQEVPITNFPGTDVPKPRFRKHDETDEEYVQFLQEYYSVYFENVKNKTEKKGTKKGKISKKALLPLNSLDGEVLTKESIDITNENKEENIQEDPIVDNIPKETQNSEKVFENNQDSMPTGEFTAQENPLMDLEGEILNKSDQILDNQDTTSKTKENSLEVSDMELEQPATEFPSNLDEFDIEDENYDTFDESEIISVKDIPKKLWEIIKSIPFVGKAIQFLENIITKNKKEEQEIIAQIEDNQIDDKEQIKDIKNSENTSYRASDKDVINAIHPSVEFDFRVKDNVDKIIVNGVEPLTGAFSSTTELFNKVENGTAYNYNDLERPRIEGVKDAINPEAGSFYISKIIKRNTDGSIEYVNSAKRDDLDSLIFEVSNKDIPDYVLARYSGKSVNESLKNQETISPKAI